jgi:hypothetical protein
MGYRITYENGVIRKQAVRVRQVKWKRWGAGAAATGLAIALMFPAGRLRIRDLLLPGDEEITAAALEGMVSDLRAGEPVGEAVESFCREIIASGT